MSNKFPFLLPLPIYEDEIKAIHAEILASDKPWARNGRMIAGNKLALEGHVQQNTETHTIHVISSTGNKCYLVDIDKKHCLCPDNDSRGWPCKHRIAAYEVIEACRRIEAQDPELQAARQAMAAAAVIEETLQADQIPDEPEPDEGILENAEYDPIEEPPVDPSVPEYRTIAGVGVAQELTELAAATLASRRDDFLVYSSINFKDEKIPVEVLESYNGDFYVRALPIDFVNDEPVYPFPFPGLGIDSGYSSTTVRFNAFVAPFFVVAKNRSRQHVQAAA